MLKGNSIKSQMCMIAALLSALVTISAASAQTIYVNASCGNDAWTGTIPACQDPDGPKATIQAAIDAAVNGDEIIVRGHVRHRAVPEQPVPLELDTIK